MLPFKLLLVAVVLCFFEGDAKFGESGARRRRCLNGTPPRRLKKRDRRVLSPEAPGGGEAMCRGLYPRLSCCSRSEAQGLPYAEAKVGTTWGCAGLRARILVLCLGFFLLLFLRRATHRPRTCRVPTRVGAMPRRGAAAAARGARARRERGPGVGLALPREARAAGAGPRPEGTRAPRGGSALPALPPALPPSYFLSAAPEFVAAAPAPVPSRCSGAGPPAGTAGARARLRGRAEEPGGLPAAEGLCARPAVPSGLGFS